MKINIFFILFSTWEIPQYRLPQSVVDFELNLVRDLGVQFEYGRSLSTKDLTVANLVNEADAVFLAIGLPQSKVSIIVHTYLYNKMYCL